MFPTLNRAVWGGGWGGGRVLIPVHPVGTPTVQGRQGKVWGAVMWAVCGRQRWGVHRWGRYTLVLVSGRTFIDAAHATDYDRA